MPTTGRRRSGSQKLASRRGAAGPDALAKALAALRQKGIKNSILVRGTPVPNVIKGAITAKSAAQAGSALGTLVKIKNIQFKPVKLFPKGTPVIDQIVIQVDGKLR